MTVNERMMIPLLFWAERCGPGTYTFEYVDDFVRSPWPGLCKAPLHAARRIDLEPGGRVHSKGDDVEGMPARIAAALGGILRERHAAARAEAERANAILAAARFLVDDFEALCAQLGEQ